ncbi:MAG: PaaI family thioesterase [Clostridia bacterium]|nr:PaaI family thioesterase [Clostridia bacterium]
MKLKVKGKQRNSKMCVMCGLDNPAGIRAPFYSMEDGSVITLFSYREEHQSYPGRVHGGLITAMLDELGLRALWAKEGEEKTYGVTTSLETKYRKPVPYGVPLLARGVIEKESGHFLTAACAVYNMAGDLLANAEIKYIKLDVNKIQEGVNEHEEMCYLIEDGVTEIDVKGI